ncbi:MAG TPA: hypothetical protein VFR14_01685 [Candidatus Limnocylindrales bacterium]|nr:hypothetical protein [Candidatus Limnocylindrales bacterium]
MLRPVAGGALVLMVCLTAVLGNPPSTRAAACGGASHAASLSGGSVSPGSGTLATSFTFVVLYSSNAGCAPTSITVTIPGVGTVGLGAGEAGPGGGTWYRVAKQLPAGSWSYRFDAVSGSGPGLRNLTLTDVSPGSIYVQAPTPPPPPPTPAATPSPTRRPPTPAPTPAPTPEPATTPVPSDVAPSASVDPSASGGAASPSASGPLAAPSAVPGGGAAAGPSSIPWGAPGAAWTVAPTSGPSAGPDRDRPTGSGEHDVDGLLGAVTLLTRSPLVEPFVAWALATSGGTGLFGFVLTRRDRRAARGRRSARDGATHSAILPADGAGGTTADDRSGVVRPSSVMGALISRPPLRFTAPAAAGVERRTVRYRLVRIGDGEDDVRSLELGRLDRGDEVEVLAWHAGHAQIRTPEGIVGWVASATILGSADIADSGSDQPGED